MSAQEPKKLVFTCPECGSHELERVYDCLTASQQVEAVYDDGHVVVTGPIEIVEEFGSWYRCNLCETSLVDWDEEDPVWKDDSLLVDWLLENRRPLQRSRRVMPDQQDKS